MQAEQSQALGMDASAGPQGWAQTGAQQLSVPPGSTLCWSGGTGSREQGHAMGISKPTALGALLGNEVGWMEAEVPPASAIPCFSEGYALMQCSMTARSCLKA